MGNQTLVWQILLQVALIGLNAVFACAEIAVISINDAKLAQLAAQGDKRAIRLAHLTSQPARFLATIQVAITLSGFLGSAFAAENFSDMLVSGLVGLGVSIPASTLDAVSVVVITLVLSYFTLVFGELVPKRFAMKKAEALALGMSGMITFISKLFAPIVWILTASTNLMLRLCGIDPSAEEDEVSEEEIRMLVDVGSEKGVIDPQEKEIINNLFEFDDLPIGEFVTHRTEICFLPMEETPEEWDKIIHENRYSLYPVCDGTADRIVGILSVKDYFRCPDKSRDYLMRHAVKPAFFVPESIHADTLFRQMKQAHQRLAVVLDEYGGVLGIITLKDLLEQLVGDLEDEPDTAEPEILALPDGTWRVSGTLPLKQAATVFGAKLPTAEFDTFAGFVFARYGCVPADGAQFEINACGLHIVVNDVRRHRLLSAIVSRAEKPVLATEHTAAKESIRQ